MGQATFLRQLAIAVGAALVVSAAPLVAEGAPTAGQKAFEANKCNNCHSIEKLEIERKIESDKMKGPDLGDVGKKRQPEWMTLFLSRKVDLDDKLHKQEYKGTEKDLKTIVEWLVSLTPKEQQVSG
jgi:hypothetical protein